MVISLTVASSCADVAQSVAHLIGSEEVTGPSPVISFMENPRYISDFDITGGFWYSEKLCILLMIQ